MSVQTDCHRVARDLKRRTRVGISHRDYPSGFALRSRLSDLRGRKRHLLPKGSYIYREMEPNKRNSGKHGRWFLRKNFNQGENEK